MRAASVMFILVLLLGLWVLRSSWAQDKLRPLVENALSDALGTSVKVGQVNIDLPAYAVLGNVKVSDQKGQPMFGMGRLRLGFASFSLIDFLLHPKQAQRIRISNLQLIGPEAHFYRSKSDSTWNFGFLSSSDSSSSSDPLKLDLEVAQVMLRAGKFSYVDSLRLDTAWPKGQIDFANLNLQRINGDISFRLNADMQMSGSLRNFNVLEGKSRQAIERIDTDYLIDLDPDSESKLTICMENAAIDLGPSHLNFDGQLEDIRPDSGWQGFYPVFSAQFRPSSFHFQSLSKLFPKPLPLGGPARIEGFATGDLHRIVSDSLKISLFEHTELYTALDLRDYTSESGLRFDLDIAHGQVSFEELEEFLPGTEIPLSGIAELQGKVNGSLSKIKAPDLQIKYLKHTFLHVDARLFEYTKGDALFMDIKFKKSRFALDEIRKLVPEMELPEWMGRFGPSSIDGQFIGGINDFVVDADVGSNYGDLKANLHLILPPKVKDITYDGWINTSGLNFADLKADLPFSTRQLNFEGKIKGTGVEFGKMVAEIEGKLTKSDIEGYLIDELVTKGLKINGYKITGGLEVTDDQGGASVAVDLDLPDSSQSYFVVGDVKRLNLAHYGILPDDPLALTTVLNINLEGKELENYTGKLRFLEAKLNRIGSKDSIVLKNVVIGSKKDNAGNHLVSLRSSLAEMSLRGEFTYKGAYNVADQVLKETKLYIKNNDSLIQDYYANKVAVPDEFHLRDTLVTKEELNQAFAFFKIPLVIAGGTRMILGLDHDLIDELNLSVLSDSIRYGTILAQHDSLTLNLTKEGSQNYLIGQGFVHTDSLHIGKDLTFEQVAFEPTADDKRLDYYLRAKQSKIGNEYQISAETKFLAEGEIISNIRSKESKVVIKGRTWTFDNNNFIRHFFDHPPSMARSGTDSIISRYEIRNLKLSSEGQQISLAGHVSKDNTDLLNLDIRNLRIHDLLEVLEQPLDMDGTVKYASFGIWDVLSEQSGVYGSGEVVNFRYQDVDSIGLRFYGGWPYVLGRDYAAMRMEAGHWGQDSVIMKGWYNFTNDSLHFDADSSSLQLSWVEPFVTGILSDMSGRVALDAFKVRGTSAKPELEGIARFTKTRFKVDYLNNHFILGDNSFKFDNKKITLDNLELRDTLGGSAKIEGFVYYNDASGIKMDLKVNPIKDFLFIDTRKADNDVFYGHLVLNGDSARIKGSLLEPEIEAWVKSGEQSWLDIPISDFVSANRLDFVKFVQHGDAIPLEELTPYTGMEMTIHVNARKNTRVRLIFDEFAGDIIEARGDGDLTIKLSKEGEFSMFGTYILDQGDYHFTLENVLNKKFIVNRGGQITWNGDPYDAQLRLEAVYKVSADISSLIPGGGGGSRVPVEIVMHMNGSLLQPEIKLELKLDQLSDQDVLGLASYFRGIQYDEQELNKQVVSLLMFRRFTANSGYFQQAGNGAANVTSSISELISNQVNHWISQTFEDPNLGVEVNSNEFQDVELALKASLFDNKVTVERNGTLIGNTNNSVSIGDLTVQIKVLPKEDTTGVVDPNAGQMVMEIFNREDASFSNAANITRGAGVFYKKDFDRLKDFFEGKGKARREEMPQVEQDNP